MRAQRCRIELLGIELRLWEAEGSREMHYKQTAPLFHPLDHLRAMELDGDGYVLDVGASIGHWAVFVALLFPRVFVRSFELTDGSGFFFRHNVRENGVEDRVSLTQAAFGDGEPVRAYVDCSRAAMPACSGVQLSGCQAAERPQPP